MKLEVKVTLRNPLDKSDTLDYYIVPDDTQLAKDWIQALKEILSNNLRLQKEFCFLGFPNTPRTLEYLCEELNKSIEIINKYDFTHHGLKEYIIEEWFHPNVVRFPDSYPIAVWDQTLDPEPTGNLGLKPKHDVLNKLHNHFEILQGTVENPSQYSLHATREVKQAIGDLNHICHEMESLILSQRKAITNPEWVRPSQITTFDNRNRYDLTDEHRKGFLSNKYDREFGHVYMHWTQIGKTLMEVFRDENAPDLDEATCEAITHLQYYSGEFDVEWAKTVTRSDKWHSDEQLEFENWLLKNGFDPCDPKLSLGYLHIGYIDLIKSFNTEDMFEIWKRLETHLDIYSIEIDGVKQIFNYCWSDRNEMD